MKIEYHPIGFVLSPFKDLKNIPRQPSKDVGTKAMVEVKSEFADGLKDLDGFSHIVLLCHFHEVTDYHLEVVPPGETRGRGLFATRSPRRPNPIGLSVVQLEKLEGNRLHISGLDILDGTLVLDIKPYFREFGPEISLQTGWMNEYQ